jgi:hypothetical protein
MVTRVSASFLAVVAAAIVVVGFLRSAQTPAAYVGFGSLLVVGVAWPMLWTSSLLGALREQSERTQRLAWAPMIVGATTILAGAAAWIVR